MAIFIQEIYVTISRSASQLFLLFSPGFFSFLAKKYVQIPFLITFIVPSKNMFLITRLTLKNTADSKEILQN